MHILQNYSVHFKKMEICPESQAAPSAGTRTSPSWSPCQAV